MLYQASYILKRKNYLNTSTNKDKINKDKGIVLSTWTFKNTLLCQLGITEEQCTIEDLGIVLNINIIDNNSVLNGISITVHETLKILLLNVSISGETINNISLLETFDNLFHDKRYINTYSGKRLCLVDSYEIIKTYDDVSSYYCNLVYPLLNEFDRKMRLLLYNTYYVLYGDEFPKKFNYYQKALGCRLYKKGDNNDSATKFCSDNIFYAYDYSQMIDILFRKNKNKSENNKSDWELFFSDKISLPTFEDDIREIKGLRNNVAHCKLFPKYDYERLKYLLTKYNNALDKAIKLTYSKDFAKEYMTSIKNALELMVSKIKELYEILWEVPNDQL